MGRAFDIFRVKPFGRTTIALHFDPRDLWVGVYWDTKRVFYAVAIHVYICIVPMFPLHFTFYVQPKEN